MFMSICFSDATIFERSRFKCAMALSETHSDCSPFVDSLVSEKSEIMAQKRVQLVIYGRVQGVFFRSATQREARRLGITGWVKNRADGTVEVLAEGDEDAIKELTSWANHGPSAARVDSVDLRWRGYTGEFPSFTIVE